VAIALGARLVLVVALDVETGRAPGLVGGASPLVRPGGAVQRL